MCKFFFLNEYSITHMVTPSESIIFLVFRIVSSGILTRRFIRRSAALRSCRFERRGDQIHEVPVFYRSVEAIQQVDETSIAVLTRVIGLGLDDVAALLD